MQEYRSMILVRYCTESSTFQKSFNSTSVRTYEYVLADKRNEPFIFVIGFPIARLISVPWTQTSPAYIYMSQINSPNQ